MSFLLRELARRTDVRVQGDNSCSITHVDTIQNAGLGAICFLANSKYRKYLAETNASAVILSEEFLGQCRTNALVCDNPYLIFSRIAALLNPEEAPVWGIHPSAVIMAGARVDGASRVGPCSVVEEGAVIESGVSIGPGCVVGRGCVVGANSRLIANVTLCRDTTIGRRAIIHPGVVIGGDGFGQANNEGVWEKVLQLGKVQIGDDVEVGANTTIDRGALQDTVIGNGVKLDNQIQIAHNVQIGDHTAIAGCAAVAGSATIGNYCTLAGGAGVVGHVEIADNVHISARALVTRSIKKPGLYSGLPAVTNSAWRRSVAEIRRLGDIIKRLRVLEKQVHSQETEVKSDRESIS